ncbi:zinc finger BED domain-containing protein RICESLEEPER 1-like [Heracleum sosnowskyi]|uniref:Zinc finger BED domain-containing protein RICESLEEPER 1-like n=1 Tax=Heracleum sosnowskyi TaxID=360622 RepID=A0AAD8IGP0_9APIA|nr:zinc finger BED domain-containing protein RICESLEEPER 1-like [Heracleum sosnowskyi]
MDEGKRKIVPSNLITSFFPRADKQQDNSARNNESGCDVEQGYVAMGRFVCAVEVSFPAVKDLTKILNPSFSFSYPELERSCLKVYREERAKVMQTMENLDGLIALSMDTLRRDTYDYHSYELPEGRTVFDYLCVRAHFIDDNWDPKSWVIYYVDVDDVYKNGTEKTILKCLSDLHIESKISTITPGDRINYDDMIETLKDQLKEKKKLQIKCQPFQIHCCSDLLRQMVEAAFEEIEDIIDRVSKHYPHWHVIFGNLQEAIELQDKGKYLEQYGFELSDFPNEKEWEKLRYVGRLVKYIHNAAEILFFTKNPTASLYLHNLLELQASLRKESTSPDRLSIATDLLQKFDEYWNDMFLVLAISTVMDPRCKMKYIEFSSLKNDDNSGNSKVTAVLEAIRGIYDDYRMQSLEALNSSKHSESKPSESKPSDSKLSDSEPSDPDSEEELPSEEEDLPRGTLERLQKCNFGFNCIDEYNEFIKPSNRPPKSELEWYLDEPVLPWTKDFDLLSWWRTESPKYPILSKMARDLLAIQLSVASSYDAFVYQDFRMADDSLDSLGPDLINALACTRSYLKKD